MEILQARLNIELCMIINLNRPDEMAMVMGDVITVSEFHLMTGFVQEKEIEF